MGLQLWEPQGGREGVAVPAARAMVPLPLPRAASWAPQPLGHWQQGMHSTLRVGEFGWEQRTWLGKARWGDEEMNFRIYWEAAQTRPQITAGRSFLRSSMEALPLPCSRWDFFEGDFFWDFFPLRATPTKGSREMIQAPGGWHCLGSSHVLVVLNSSW